MKPSREDYLKYLRRQEDYRQYGELICKLPQALKLFLQVIAIWAVAFVVCGLVKP